MEVKPIEARLQISGVLEFRDADGNIIGTTEMRGDFPIDLNQEAEDGADDSERV